MSDATKGENNPCFGRTGENHPKFGKARPAGAGSPSQQISVFDKKKNETTIYDSISEASRALDIPNSSIRLNLKTATIYKDRYIFKKILCGYNGLPLFMYNRDMSILYYYTSEQINFITKFSVHHTTFTKHLNNGTYYLGKYKFLR